MGTCSGGRHTVIAASKIDGFTAAADLWGGRVVMGQEALNEKNPVAPIDMTPDLKVPLLGLFGEDDGAPSPPEVAQHEAALKAAGKEYEFHTYPGAGHGFFYYDRAAYRQEQAVDGWNKLFGFFSKHLGS
jgi:carboxymethylenebutenolidase